MGELVHILFTPVVSTTPWWPTDERLDDLPSRIWTDCCCCKMPPEDTVCSYTSYYDPPLGGMGGEFIWGGDWEEQYWPTGAWYGGDWHVRCADGCGCNVRPSRKIGKHLREAMRWAA